MRVIEGKSEINVLLVEDDLDYRALVLALLPKPPFHVYPAETPQVAYELFERHRPDLVLMDIGLAYPGGIVATDEIRKRARALKHEVVIIMSTGSSRMEDVKRALHFGADDYMVKPISRGVLYEKIHTHFPAVPVPRRS